MATSVIVQTVAEDARMACLGKSNVALLLNASAVDDLDTVFDFIRSGFGQRPEQNGIQG